MVAVVIVVVVVEFMVAAVAVIIAGVQISSTRSPGRLKFVGDT